MEKGKGEWVRIINVQKKGGKTSKLKFKKWNIGMANMHKSKGDKIGHDG